MNFEKFFLKSNAWLPVRFLNLKGILHVGAHEAEEIDDYTNVGIKNIIWIEALPEKKEIILKKISKFPEMIFGSFAAGDKEGKMKFNVSSKTKSSSLLNFGTHKDFYPEISIVSEVEVKLKKIDNWISSNNIEQEIFNFLVLDIQGYELKALKGMKKHLKYVDYIWTEINSNDLYIGSTKINDLDQFLSNYEFSRVGTFMSGNGWGDALYTKKYKKRLKIYMFLIKFLKVIKSTIRFLKN
tara:strand:- start:54 stop:773 length:720 start_codon:yes stop_codon:yes gene_type:complete